jgi:hypothetical protein
MHPHTTRVGGLMGCQRLKKLWLFQNKISVIEGLHAVRISARFMHALSDTLTASHHSLPPNLCTPRRAYSLHRCPRWRSCGCTPTIFPLSKAWRAAQGAALSTHCTLHTHTQHTEHTTHYRLTSNRSPPTLPPNTAPLPKPHQPGTCRQPDIRVPGSESPQ